MPNPDLHDFGGDTKVAVTPEFAARQRRKDVQLLVFGAVLGVAALAFGLYARTHGGTYVDTHHVTLPWWWIAGAGVFILAISLFGLWRAMTRRG